MISILGLWSKPPLIGVLHSPPLPGSPRDRQDWPQTQARVLHDLQAYQQGGADGLVLENFGDAPFYPDGVPAETVAHMTALALLVRQHSKLPLGINVLRNDGIAALAIAAAAQAQFIRVNILCGARLTDQGVISGIAHDLLRLRRQWGGEHIRIVADVDVKHSAPLAPRELEDEVEELLARGGADALIVTGRATGAAVDVEHLQRVKNAAAASPVFVGSGASSENAATLLRSADGLIVGSSLKRAGIVHNEVEPARVAALRSACDRAFNNLPE